MAQKVRNPIKRTKEPSATPFGEPFVIYHEPYIFGKWMKVKRGDSYTWHLYDHSQFQFRVYYAWGVSNIEHSYQRIESIHYGSCGMYHKYRLKLKSGWDRIWGKQSKEKRHVCPRCARILRDKMIAEGLLVRKGHNLFCTETLDRWFKKHPEEVDTGEKAWYDI
jgi:hypothetical protein